MRSFHSMILGASALFGAAFLPLAASAQTQGDPIPPTRDEIVKMLDAELPRYLTENNEELVAKLLKPRLGTPLSKSFNRGMVVKDIFGRTPPTYDPTCARTSTQTGEPDPGRCIASRGDKAGGGAYTELQFSKNLGFGDIKIFRRPVDPILSPASLKPVRLGDQEAYKIAMEYLVGVLGLPPEEIPPAPPNARNPFPVKTLNLGFDSEKGERGQVAIQKVAMIQRGLLVDIDPELPFVPGPGHAMVVMDDTGIRGAKVQGWSELVPNPRLDPKQAKSRSELIAEITKDLLQEVQAPIASMKFQIRIEGVPDGSRMAIIPCVRMSVSPLMADPTEEQQQNQWTTAGMVMDYELVSGAEPAAD